MRRLIAAALALALAASARAGEGPTIATPAKEDLKFDTNQRAATEASNVSTVGDYIKFNVKAKGFTLKDSVSTPATELTAPAGSCFRVSKEYSQNGKAMLRGVFETGHFPRGLWPPYRCADLGSAFDPSSSYDVPKQVLDDYDRTRFGWTFGVLVAPVKYYVKPHEFSAGASVGPYLGYRVHDRQGSASVIALSVGAATATVSTTDANGATTSTNTTGLTVAAAYLVEIKSAFNVGLLAGTDIYSKSENIATSNKLWLGLSFGYKLE